MFGLSPFELAAIGVIAVVLFGGNLPEVARKFGGMYANIRKSVSDVQQQIRQAEYEATKAVNSVDPESDSEPYDDGPSEPAAPKFKPPE